MNNNYKCNRELSWLQFNDRVLMQADDKMEMTCEEQIQSCLRKA